MKPKFMIKYGKEEHLQQLVDGKIRFAPSQTYVRLEEAQHNKGQGDLLEGKMKIKMQSARLHSIETNELIRELPAGTMVVSLQDVNNMPVFCISQYDERQISDYTDELHYTITLSDEKIECIQNDFPEASHALIILEPDKFINEVRNIDGHRFVSDSIRYYDYDINPLQNLWLCGLLFLQFLLLLSEQWLSPPFPSASAVQWQNRNCLSDMAAPSAAGTWSVSSAPRSLPTAARAAHT